jgi:hypothetical protein
MTENLESKIKQMSDGQISEIIFNSDDWNERAIQYARAEALSRGLSLEIPHPDVVYTQVGAKLDSVEPLSFGWRTLAVLSPLGVIPYIAYEKFKNTGQTSKAEEMKSCMIFSIVVWVGIPFIFGILREFWIQNRY